MAADSGLKVCKFGGSSLADGEQVRKVCAIVAGDDARRVVVPSAPGKRSGDDQKVTDLLYLCHEHARQGLGFDEVFGLVAERFVGMAAALGVSLDMGPVLAEAKRGIAEHAAASGASGGAASGGGAVGAVGACGVVGGGADFAASRGEFLNGRLLASALGWPFVDAAEVVFFDERGRLDAGRTYAAIVARVGDGCAVIPGFYGSTPGGEVKTFSRGGSDVTGAIVARALGAAVYENWTDVSGLLMTDPRIVDRPATIETLTYRELRELSYMGATVLHAEAVFPVRDAGIPVNIRNTNEPAHPGTRIVASAGAGGARYPITGIAGRKDFTIIAIEKALMNNEIGFGEKVLAVLRRHGISFEHMPSGIDTMSLVIEDAQLEGKRDAVVEDLKREVEPDCVEVDADLALIATVGRAMMSQSGMASRLFGALGSAGVNIRMIDQGSSELNIIVGVNTGQFEDAVRAIYAAFVG